MSATGTALAVVHNPCLRGRPNRRIAVVCACKPDAELGVLGLDAWDARKVLDVQHEHEAAVSQREKSSDSWTRSVLEVPTVAEAVLEPAQAEDGPAEDKPETKTEGAFK